MPVITIETNFIADNCYELIQTVNVGFACIGEITQKINAPDRMVAAMTNLGMACRWFIDRQQKDGIKQIAIQRDFTNPDELAGNEHNDLFKAVSNLHNHLFGNVYQYRQDRLKYQAFYGDYVRYLDRIIDYIIEWQIHIKLIDYKEALLNEYTDETY